MCCPHMLLKPRLQVWGACWVAQTLHGPNGLEAYTKKEQKSITCPMRKQIFVVLPQTSHIITYQGSRLVDSSEFVFCNSPVVVKVVKH